MSEESDAATINLARDMRQILLELREVTRYMKEAESEVPEKMRRFIMYMHDVHDIKHLYEEHGQPPPDYLIKEVERCADRYRHLLKEGNTDLGWIEKVRSEMTKEPGNRYDHTHLLATEKGIHQ